MQRNIYCVLFLITLASSGFVAAEESVRFQSDGSAVFAVDTTTSKPVWSDDGLLYRERYSIDVERLSELERRRVRPIRPVPMLQRHGRLYVILEKTTAPNRPNVLVSLDIQTEGKLVFRRDSVHGRPVRFVRFVSLIGDDLTVELADGSTTVWDVATGELTPFTRKPVP